MQNVNVVRAFVYNKKGGLLLGRRSENNNFAGLWELPGAKIDSGGCF